MKAYIYKITNDINNKVYIGKTTNSIDHRFNQHKINCQKQDISNRPLYKAMKKYGIEHFSISLLEVCDSVELSEREKYWIEQYNSYHNGYNATLGGDGAILYNYDEIKTLLQNGKTTQEICSIIGCGPDTVRLVAKNNNIFITQPKNSLTYQLEQAKKRVGQYDLQGNKIQEFESYISAAHWLVEQGMAKTAKGARPHISHVCSGKRKSAYGYIWKDMA